MTRKKLTKTVDKKIKKLKFYTLDRILERNAHYNIIYGERSNGKTFSVLELIVKNYYTGKGKGAIIRRYDLDFQGKRGDGVFEHLVVNEIRGNVIEELTNGQWTDVYYWSMRWYMCKYDEKGNRVKDAEPFCYAFSLNATEHDKSTSFPDVTTILFDEFMTRKYYLPDEFILFTNVLSTIIRYRDDVKVFMCANTVNKYGNLYFTEMGITRYKQMKPGDIDVYKFAVMNEKKDVLTIAVEYADSPNKDGKPSDVYFAFNNPKLKMITGGMWEMDVYPHLPYKYEKQDIEFTFFIVWENEILQCEVISISKPVTAFLYLHRKTTPLRDEDNDLVYSTEYSGKFNWRRKITQPMYNVEKKMNVLIKNEKIFFQDNEVGEIWRNYIQWCKTDVGFV